MTVQLKRREFITLVGGAAAWPLAARAQQGERMRRIGVLAGGALETQERNAAFAQTLQQLGWTNGDNVRIDYRYGLGNAANVRKYAAELVSLAPDVILASGASPDDRFHHCIYYPMAIEFDRSGAVWESKPKTRCFFAPMNSS